MKKLNNKSYNLLIAVLISLFFICSITAFISINENFTAHAYGNQETLVEGYDFSDNSVIVTMDKEVGGVNKVHNKSYFGNIAIANIIDLTYRKNVKNVDLDRFKQILKLELKRHDKNYVLHAVEKIGKLKGVESVGPNYIRGFCATANDSDYKYQWGLNGVNGINIEPAWDITTGSKDIRVGVIDTGIAQHPDLVDNLASGWNFYNNDKYTDDTYGHGTHVAGIIGAVGDNDIGISGVCKNVELVPLKISHKDDWPDDDIIAAITYADELWGTAQQIDLLNFSGGGPTYNTNFFNAINTFRGLFICSAGNNGKNIDSKPEYPASFKCDNMIVVGAINSNGDRWSSSNYGENTVDIYAPGYNIWSTYNNSNSSRLYCYMDGTSMAAPHVTGVAALLLSQDPTLNAAELKGIILHSTDDITISTPDGNQRVKKLNAYKAVESVEQGKYNVTLHFNDGFGGQETITVSYGEQMPLPPVVSHAPGRAGYSFVGYFSNPDGTGTQYYSTTMMTQPNLEWDYSYYEGLVSLRTWDKRCGGELYGYWKLLELDYVCENLILNVGELEPTEFHLVHNEKLTYTARDNFSGYKFSYFNVTGTPRYESVLNLTPKLEISEATGQVRLVNWFFAVYVEIPYYTQNGIEVSILGKNGGTWTLKVTNRTGSPQTFEYNTKMCFKNDAANWNLSADVSKFSLANGASHPIDINENAMATSIAISYMDGDYRKIFYADGLNASSSTMSSYGNTIDPTTSECVAAGTLITLANGEQVAVENLQGNEMLLVWNLHTGTFDTAPILFIDSDPSGMYEVINLHFSDGTNVKVISEHGFWDYDLNKYVYLDKNAAQYVGHWFNKGDTKVQLTSVEISEEYTTPYSPVTYGHLCYYVDGMLSMPGGISGLFNIFDVDAETMMYDEASMQLDIQTYGLFTYEEFYELYNISEEVFEAFNGQYLKVAIGKGLISYEQIQGLIDRYGNFFE